MKFIWLITILLICLRLCFCFLCCNTSLLALPAFIQCLTGSHFGEQTEDFHKNPHQTQPCRQSLRSHLKPSVREKHRSNVHTDCSRLLLEVPILRPFGFEPHSPQHSRWRRATGRGQGWGALPRTHSPPTATPDPSWAAPGPACPPVPSHPGGTHTGLTQVEPPLVWSSMPLASPLWASHTPSASSSAPNLYP